VAAGTVYVGSGPSVVALAADDGTREWTFEADARVTTAPVVAGSTVYAGTRRTGMYALNAGTGRELAAFDPGGPLAPADRGTTSRGNAPAVAGGRLYLGTVDGRLYALDERSATDGTTPWGVVGGGVVALVGGGAWLWRRRGTTK
jgi:outer membrane protein assembly factor BamB